MEAMNEPLKLTDYDLKRIIADNLPAIQKALEVQERANLRVIAVQNGINPDSEQEMDLFSRAWQHEQAEEAEPNLQYAARKASYEIRQQRSIAAGRPIDYFDAAYRTQPAKEEKAKPEPTNDRARATANFDRAYEANDALRAAKRQLDDEAEFSERARTFGYEEE